MTTHTADDKGDTRRDFLGKTSLLITGIASLGAVATCLRLIQLVRFFWRMESGPRLPKKKDCWCWYWRPRRKNWQRIYKGK